MSSFLHDHLEVGNLVDVSAPAGDFVVTEADTPLLLASAGAGITTVLPIIEHVAKTQPERTVIVAHADRTSADHNFRDTVQHVGRLLDGFSSYTWYETVADGDTRSRQGLMDLSVLKLPPDVQGFTCGPLPFMPTHPLIVDHARGAAGTDPLRGVRTRPVGGPDRGLMSWPPEQRRPSDWLIGHGRCLRFGARFGGLWRVALLGRGGR